MANEWITSKLSVLCEFRAGSVFSPEYQGQTTGRYPFVKVSDMNLPENSVWIQSANNWISETARDALKAKPLPRGTVIFAKIGEALRQNRLRQLVRDTVIDNNMMGAVPRQERVDAEYFYYALSQFDFADIAHGTALPYLTVASLSELQLRYPPLEIQRAIARILRPLDNKIELNRKTNETLEAMARALFKSWFVDFDPVRAKAEGRAPSGMDAATAALFPREFVESALGPIPQGWFATPVYDIAKYVNGAAYKAFEPNDDRRGLPIIKIAELKAGVTAQTKFSDVSMPEKYRLRIGDILFSWSGNPDTSIDTFIWAHGDAWLNQHIFRVDLHSPSDRSFVLATLKYLRPAFAEIARNKQTTGLGHVTAGDMQRLLVVKPDARALAAWERLASPLFAAVFRNELESLALARVRDELLPRLLSGELSVTQAERFAERV